MDAFYVLAVDYLNAEGTPTIVRHGGKPVSITINKKGKEIKVHCEFFQVLIILHHDRFDVKETKLSIGIFEALEPLKLVSLRQRIHYHARLEKDC